MHPAPITPEQLAAARAAWPGVELAEATFSTYVGERVAPDALAAACLADLYLACAVVHGDAAALRAFEVECLRDVEAAIAHLDGGSALAADVRAAIRERVLAAPAGGRAKLAEYRGRGDLRGWLRVVAVREALQLLRARRRETSLEHATDRDAALAAGLAAAPPDDVPAEERRLYREAFEAALATLSARERNLLRQQYVYGASIDELAALYGVHRATVARWVARTRELVLRRTRRHVGEVLRLAGEDLDSVMGRLANHLDYSLRQTLSIEAREAHEG